MKKNVISVVGKYVMDAAREDWKKIIVIMLSVIAVIMGIVGYFLEIFTIKSLSYILATVMVVCLIPTWYKGIVNALVYIYDIIKEYVRSLARFSSIFFVSALLLYNAFDVGLGNSLFIAVYIAFIDLGFLLTNE
jgi:uncharacterized membrane protein